MAKAKEKPKKEKTEKPAKPAKAAKAAKAPKIEKAAKAAKAPKPAPVAEEPKAKVAKAPKVEVAKPISAELSEEEAQLVKKWQKLQKQYAEEKPQNYAITGFYDVKTPIIHKILGWGVVLNRRENYIDVLFETGMKTLLINFKN